MIRALLLLFAIVIATPTFAADTLDGQYRVGATVTIKDNQVVGLSKVTVFPARQQNDDSIDIHIGPLDIIIPQSAKTQDNPHCDDDGFCEIPLKASQACPGPCPSKPVLLPTGEPQRVYMIYHPKKNKYLGVAIIGGLVAWVDQDEAIVLPNKKAAQAQIDALLGSKRSVVLKAFLLLPVNVR